MECVNTAFADLLASLRRDIADPTTASAVCSRLQRFWDSPPCVALEFLLRRGVGPTFARALLFAPAASEEGMGLYPLLLLSAPPDAPDTHPARQVQVPFLSLLPSHLRAWRRAEAFVFHGGMGALARLLLEPNPALRVQAIEVMLQITSHKGFSWFEAPAEGNDTARRLHAAVLALAQPAGPPGAGAAAVPFLAALLANWDNPLPGASFNCLQLAAWWLSWVRLLHTGSSQTLRLSRPLLDGLRAWAERPVAPEGEEGNSSSGGGGGGGGGVGGTPPSPLRFSLPEEAALAKKVYEDFSRFPAVDEGGVAGISASSAALPPPLPSMPAALRSAVGALREDGAAAGEAAPAPADSAAALKEEGNAHFRGERWAEAAAAYSKGIALLTREGGAAPAGAVARELLLALLSNRAFSRLRSSGYGSGVAPCATALDAAAVALGSGGGGGGGARRRALAVLRAAADAVGVGGEEGVGSHAALLGKQPILGIFGCLVDCARALALDGDHVKSLFRRAQAFLALRAAGEALRAARECIARCRKKGAASGELLAQANTLVSYGVAMQNAGEEEEEGGAAAPAELRGAAGAGWVASAGKREEGGGDSEDAILAALMQRQEFGGGGGGNDGSGGVPPPPPPPPTPPQQEQPPPPAPIAGALHMATTAAPRAAAPLTKAVAPPNVEDVLAGRAAVKGGKKPTAAPKTFSLPSL